MSRRITALAVLFVFTLLIATAWSTSNKYGVADRRRVEFSQPVRIGDTLVPAGSYDVQHTMEGEEHVMVFTQRGAGKVTARAKCTLEPTNRPVQQSQVGYISNERGEVVLVRMQFKGDTAVHIFRATR